MKNYFQGYIIKLNSLEKDYKNYSVALLVSIQNKLHIVLPNKEVFLTSTEKMFCVSRLYFCVGMDKDFKNQEALTEVFTNNHLDSFWKLKPK